MNAGSAERNDNYKDYKKVFSVVMSQRQSNKTAHQRFSIPLRPLKTIEEFSSLLVVQILVSHDPLLLFILK